MGRPTIASQLAKAAAAGDIEKIKELAAKLDKQTKPKPKSKSKSKVKAKPQVMVYEEEIVEGPELSSPGNEGTRHHTDMDSFITPARRPTYQEKFLDEDGKERVRMRTVPFKVVKNRKNKWKDDLNEKDPDVEFDRIVHKNGPVNVQHREKVTKVKVRCSRCKQIKIVWPGEVSHSNWACDDCLTSNRIKG